MEGRLSADLPKEDGWQFEPKWDGFRALAVRNGAAVGLWSKSGKPLDRFFPEIVEHLARSNQRHFVLDGELVIETEGALAFDALQARLHPAQSRIDKLSRETPAKLILFDCLSVDKLWLADRPLSERRAALEAFHAENGGPDLLLSPATSERKAALGWLKRSGAALDGVIAKRLDEPYRFGERAMLKVKPLRTADCVVGGYRTADDGSVVSLLLGLFDDARCLDLVGFVSGLSVERRLELAPLLEAHSGGPGFTGRSPGGQSRWNGGKERPYQPLDNQLVLEVTYDQVTARRFRHGARFVRWRPDKAPEQCTFDQLAPPVRPSELVNLKP